VTSIGYLLLGLALGIVLGGLIGWLLGQRRGSRTASDPLLTELRQQAQRQETELGVARGQLLELQARASTAEAARAAADRLLMDQRQLYETQWQEARQAQEKALLDLRDAFKALSADALRQTQPEFLRLATETLAKYQESAKGDLAQRQQSIATLLEPLKQQLDTYQKRLQQGETAQAQALG
jgi:DNA recombination protein RmuC